MSLGLNFFIFAKRFAYRTSGIWSRTVDAGFCDNHGIFTVSHGIFIGRA